MPLRAAFTLAVASCAILTWLFQSQYRGWEAWSAGRMSALVTGDPFVVSRPLTSFFLEMNTTHGFGLRVTGECTSAMVTIAVCLVTATLAVATRLPLLRLTVAASAATMSFYVLNIVRLVGIALATMKWGRGAGFHWSHVWAGSFVTMFGGILVCALYFILLGVRRRQT